MRAVPVRPFGASRAPVPALHVVFDSASEGRGELREHSLTDGVSRAANSINRLGMEFPVLPRLAWLYLQSMKSWRLPRSELKRIQDKKLRRVVREAYDHLPLYKSQLSKLGLSPGDLRGTEDLGKLMTITKADVRSSYPWGIRRRDIRAALVRGGTGTTGVSSRIAITAEKVDLENALRLRRLFRVGVRPWTKLVTAWPPSSHWRKNPEGRDAGQPVTQLSDMPFSGALASIYPKFGIFRADPANPAREARNLALLSPEFIVGRASFLRRAGVNLRAHGLAVSPRALICGTENFTHAVERELRELYNSEVVRAYGSAEFGPVGGECMSLQGLHLYEDYMIFEVLKEGEQVAPGETGELVITGLHNDVMPLIRYRTGDIVRRADEERCSCGSSLMRVSAVLGREDDGLVTEEGRRVAAMGIAEDLESRFGLRDYQIVQESLEKIVVKLPGGSMLEPQQSEKLVEYLEGCLDRSLDVRIEERGEEEVWMKYRPVLSKIAS